MSEITRKPHRFQVSLLMTVAAIGTLVWFWSIRGADPITTIVFWSVFGGGYLVLVMTFHYMNARAEISDYDPRP